MSKKILVLMLVSFAITSAASLGVLINLEKHSSAQVFPLPTGGKICAPTATTPSWFPTFWVPIFVFEVLLCTLAIVSVFRTRKQAASTDRIGIVDILVRDSIAYFIIIGATYMTCFLMWLKAPIRFTDIPVYFTIAMSCVSGSRVLLNVRRAAVDPSANLTGFDSQQTEHWSVARNDS
ncbi:hypothetical protein GALMADRAFT_254371 [Galerina marginata CBS 339.88]|uniref:MARVEL domain-containing protein n=1 Tax=Galerina marginata (strain CBS 339.88) TaxID=685588 RepID=A0A067STX1_GALM3|nr:hypothetical protein GALMADRAFT_254371 [Galerina marginata CBS 339.88]